MKKQRFLAIIISLLTGIITYAQVGIGTNTPDSSAVLHIESDNKGVLFPHIALLSASDAVTITNPEKGLIVYNTSSAINGSGLYINNGTSASPSWRKYDYYNPANPVQNVNTLIYDGTTTNASKLLNTEFFEWRFISSGTNYGVQARLKNTSSLAQSIKGSVLTWTNLASSYINVDTSWSPGETSWKTLFTAGDNLNTQTYLQVSNDMNKFYKLGTRVNLNSYNMMVLEVFGKEGVDVRCDNGSWTTPVSPAYKLDGLRTGQAYSGTYHLPYTHTGSVVNYPQEILTQNGLTLTLAAGIYNPSGNLIYTLSGTYTGTDHGSVNFVTSSGCSVYLGPCASCKEILDRNLSSTSGTYWIDIDQAAPAYGSMQAYCDMTTDGGGWTLIGQFNHPATLVTTLERNSLPNRGSDNPSGNETSGTGVFGTWGLANVGIRQAITMTEYRVESYTATNGFHFKSTDVNFIKNNSNELPTGKTDIGKPSYWPAAATYHTHCPTVHNGGHQLLVPSYVTFAHSNTNCKITSNYLISRVTSSTATNVNQGLTNVSSTNGLGRLYVR